ncbi:MAG: insulinase family protein [Bacteroidales bacterium]|nr:insulinase family protein [Bacteroidales bacterium]
MSTFSIDRDGLVPLQYTMPNGNILYYFPDSHIDIVKIDILFNAGTVMQDKLMQSAASIQLITEGTSRHTAREIAEFMDFRGIVIEKNNDEVSATVTVYTLSRYIAQLLPLLHEMITEATYPDEEFAVYINKYRQKIQTAMQKTSYVSRKLFYRGLYGKDHPQGRFATLSDIDSLTVDDVRSFHSRFHHLRNAVFVLSGNVTDEVLALFGTTFGCGESPQPWNFSIPAPSKSATGLIEEQVEGAVQNTLCVGRRLPYKWDDMEYARFMVLSTVLGGYFGSRLMTNIREDKGYTYGIYSQTRIFRDSIAFYIVSDVSSSKVKPALEEIMHELECLRKEHISADELELVRSCMMGDFMRSIDGIFERSERFRQQFVTGVTEQFTENYISAVESVTPVQLQQIASRIFSEGDLLTVSAGMTMDYNNTIVAE